MPKYGRRSPQGLAPDDHRRIKRLTTTEEKSIVPHLRADARENRERVLTAAKEVFSESGIDAPMSEIARRAGVGIATLFRRFPTREDLIAESFADKMEDCADSIESALTMDDPWDGFCSVVDFITSMQATDRGFTRVLMMSFPSNPAFETPRLRGYKAFAELIVRAKSAGRLRPDFVPQDLGILVMANAGILWVAGDTAPEAWRRFVAYQLQAFSPGHKRELPPPPSKDQLAASVEALRMKCQRAVDVVPLPMTL